MSHINYIHCINLEKLELAEKLNIQIDFSHALFLERILAVLTRGDNMNIAHCTREPLACLTTRA